MTGTMHLMLGISAILAIISPALAQTQTDMNAAAAQKAKTADQALNAQYKATSGKISASSRLLLRNAQRSWIGYRDQQCKYEASGVQGGSAYPMVYSGCLMRVSNERTQQLKKLGQCEEGDLSCPR